MEASDFVSGDEFHRRRHKKDTEENISLSTMRIPISAKERTKAKFDQLLKTALEEAKLKPPLTKNRIKKADILKNDDDDREEEEERELKTSEIIKLTKKKKLKDDKLGLLNPVYEDDSTTTKESTKIFLSNRNIEEDTNWKQVKQERNASKCPIIEMEEFPTETPKKMPRTKRKKSKTNLNGHKTVTNGHPEISETSLVNTNNEHETLRNGDTNLSNGNKFKNRVVVRAEVYNGNSNIDNGLTETNDSTESTPSKSSKRQNRRRHKQLLETDPFGVSTSERNVDLVRLPNTSSDNGFVTEADVQKSNQSDASERVGSYEENNNILGITIHRVDRLKINHKIKHPLVRVHIIDGNTGTYLKKSDKAKLVTAVYENQNSNVDFVMSVMTQPCELKHNKCIFPIWEETLIFNENFDHFVKSDSSVIVFFEVLDFLPMAAITSQQSKYNAEGGWYRIAWAFLKIVGANDILNTGRKIRLQLYYPPKQRIRPEPRILDVYHWWSQLPKVPYPSTVFVTVSSLSPPKNLPPTLRSMAPMQLERGKMTLDRPGVNSVHGTQVIAEVAAGSPRESTTTLQWSRLPGQTCKVPNKQILSLATDKKGCFVAKFSYSGKFLACGCQSDTSSYILIYEIPSGGLVSRLQGHSGLIYDLNWTKNDSSLLSASADGTARIWSPLKNNFSANYLLPHPSFVYCADYHPSIQSVIVTGCYDNLIRVWCIKESEQSPQLVQELEVHNGHVNSICFNLDGNKLFSGDGFGVICIWNVATTKHRNGKGLTTNLTLCHEIKEPQLKGVAINTVLHHPNVHRVLIQTRDGCLRMLDYEKMQFVQSYKGFLNLCEHLRGCISPCGTLVFTGSEDGYVYVWNCITGDIVATYSSLPYHQTVHCVAYHSHDHMIAFCYQGNKNAVVVYKYDFQFAPLQVNQVQPQMSERNRLPGNQMFTSTPQSHFGKRTVSFGVTSKESLPSLEGTSALEKIIKKLDSVLETTSSRSEHPSHESDSMSKFLSASTANSTILSWNTTFESTAFSNFDTNENLRAMAQYDYMAQRSDELTFKNGDVINILKTESDQWLVGRTSDGKQGYVPANYVIIVDNDETTTSAKKKTDVTAVLTKSGQLTFISDSDSDS